LISYPENQGYGAAIKKGFEKASMDALKAAKTPLVFFTDSDGQYHPPDFWKLYRNIDND